MGIFAEVMAVDTIPALVIVVIGALCCGGLAVGGMVMAALIIGNRLERFNGAIDRLTTVIGDLSKRMENVERMALERQLPHQSQSTGESK